MHSTAAQIGLQCAPVVKRYALNRRQQIDGRTRPGKRIAALERSYQAQLGRKATRHQKSLIRQCATLRTLSEMIRDSLLIGAGGKWTSEDLTRTENSLRRSERDLLGLSPRQSRRHVVSF